MSKLISILFSRRTLAILVAIVMVLQLLPLATIADNAEGDADAVDVVAVDRSSTEIGEMVMNKLRYLDDVAYVRFASVYREFKDVETFLREIEKLAKKK